MLTICQINKKRSAEVASAFVEVRADATCGPCSMSTSLCLVAVILLGSSLAKVYWLHCSKFIYTSYSVCGGTEY